MRKIILAIIILLSFSAQGCVVTATAIAGFGVLAAKGYFKYKDQELKEDLQDKNHELDLIKLKNSK